MKDFSGNILAMKKVFLELVYDFKGKLLLHVVFFFWDLRRKVIARKHNLVSKDEKWKIFGKLQVFKSGMAQYTMLV